MVLILNGLVQLMELFAFKRWRTCGQLECIAPIAPYVDLLAVRQSKNDLWTDPVRCTSLRHPLLLFICKELTETEVSNLDCAIRICEDAVTLDASM